ncbi:hypothetical protein JDV02_009550 [Purpureocillium takamizusanense]|uniref:DUF6594 domain-containing protein n=1 Tax=Purpureocillium takamizusanense TaxID=2060973 RepID=A0A9Q8VEC5_9HYPO|nr:uncharacterized protein JDV02_009550 [Purpureocillium takamizusanense]UNI23750.1 hypothetical protein JDV02_009550 [Purpureocillium takamizusanense]
MAVPAAYWRDEGYPGFSKWMASSDDFLVLRRFGQLNVRVLLLMQDRIVRKEEQLANIDAHGRLSADKADSSSLRLEPLPEREAILDELKVMLHEYNEYILAFSQIRSWRSAQDRQVENIENWFYNHPYAIDSKEQEFVRTGRDIVAPASKPKPSVRLMMERCAPLLHSRMFRVKPKSNQTQSGTTLYFSNTRFDAFVTLTVIAAGLMLLLGPMWWLQFVADSVKRLGIITGFILLFTGLLASATVAKPFEVMAATAAYSAVLMVFLQIGGSAGK